MSDIVERLRRQSEHNLEHCECDVLLARDVFCIRCQSTMVEQEAADHIAALEARYAHAAGHRCSSQGNSRDTRDLF